MKPVARGPGRLGGRRPFPGLSLLSPFPEDQRDRKPGETEEGEEDQFQGDETHIVDQFEMLHAQGGHELEMQLICVVPAELNDGPPVGHDGKPNEKGTEQDLGDDVEHFVGRPHGGVMVAPGAPHASGEKGRFLKRGGSGWKRLAVQLASTSDEDCVSGGHVVGSGGTGPGGDEAGRYDSRVCDGAGGQASADESG